MEPKAPLAGGEEAPTARHRQSDHHPGRTGCTDITDSCSWLL